MLNKLQKKIKIITMVPMGFATINDLYLTNEHSSGVYMTLHVERKSVHVFALID